MQNAVPKEGPRAPLFCSVAVVLFLSLSARDLAAQSVDLSSLEQCARLQTQELKLACFEAIITAGRETNLPPPKATSSVVPEVAPIEVEGGRAASPVASEESSDLATDAVTEAVSEPAGNPDPATTTVSAAAQVVPAVIPDDASPEVEPEPESAEQQDSIAASLPAPVPAAAEPPAGDFGAEQLPDANREASEMIAATVVEVRQGYNRALSFYLANGQVWRQIEPRRLQYPRNETFDVTISRGMLGDYRLRIGKKGRLVKIRRVQ